MHGKKRALLAAGLLAGAAAMTGCTANTMPVSTPTPKAEQQATAQPATAQPAAETTTQPAMEAAGEESPGPSSLTVDGKTLQADAIREQERLLLPLVETAQALGWKAESEETQQDTQIKRVITLDREDSRITVAWTVSDNTAKGITWQKDGLLIPVDTRITTRDGVVYVPAAFFEEAMDAGVSETKTGVVVSTPKPMDTPQTMEESSGKNS